MAILDERSLKKTNKKKKLTYSVTRQRARKHPSPAPKLVTFINCNTNRNRPPHMFTYSHTHTLTHSHTHTLTHTRTLTHSHTHTLTHSHTYIHDTHIGVDTQSNTITAVMNQSRTVRAYRCKINTQLSNTSVSFNTQSSTCPIGSRPIHSVVSVQSIPYVVSITRSNYIAVRTYYATYTCNLVITCTTAHSPHWALFL